MANDSDAGRKTGNQGIPAGELPENGTAAETFKHGMKEKGIILTIDEAQECVDNLKEFFKLLNKWDLEDKQRKKDISEES